MNKSQRATLQNEIKQLEPLADSDEVLELGFKDAMEVISDSREVVSEVLAEEQEKYDNMFDGASRKDDIEEGIGILEEAMAALDISMDEPEEGWEETVAAAAEEAIGLLSDV